MKPYQHARSSAHQFGGRWQDYLAVHNVFDASKATFAAPQHRALLHNALGVEVCVQINAEHVMNSAGAAVATRDLAKQHLLEDLGYTPSLDDWLATLDRAELPGRRRLPPHIAAFGGDPVKAARRLWGGEAADWAAFMAFFDLPTTLSKDPRAGWFLWNSLGCWLAEQALGPVVADGDGRELIATREAAEHLIQGRMQGFLPSPFELFSRVRLQPWMTGARVADGIRADRRTQDSNDAGAHQGAS